jgi:hypothetical protein
MAPCIESMPTPPSTTSAPITASVMTTIRTAPDRMSMSHSSACLGLATSLLGGSLSSGGCLTFPPEEGVEYGPVYNALYPMHV